MVRGACPGPSIGLVTLDGVWTMRSGLKIGFRPTLERCEARVVATGGVASALPHPATSHPTVHIEAHHAKVAHHAKASTPAVHATPQATTTTTAATPPRSTAVTSNYRDTTTDQAWVEIVNTTGETLEYQIKLAPYANGQFLTFDIAPGEKQYQWSSLISNYQRVKADFAIQFGNGAITPLMTGINEANAQGYDIFLDNNLQPYVAPFVHS